MRDILSYSQSSLCTSEHSENLELLVGVFTAPLRHRLPVLLTLGPQTLVQDLSQREGLIKEERTLGIVKDNADVCVGASASLFIAAFFTLPSCNSSFQNVPSSIQPCVFVHAFT